MTAAGTHPLQCLFIGWGKLGRCIALPIIYLSPSTQDWNPYINGGTEEEWMNLLADKMVPFLHPLRPTHAGHDRRALHHRL